MVNQRGPEADERCKETVVEDPQDPRHPSGCRCLNCYHAESREDPVLLDHGREIEQVAILHSVLWRKDGRLYTTEAALTEVWTIREDP